MTEQVYPKHAPVILTVLSITFALATALVSTSASAQPPATKAPVPPPEFKNLRFDERWTPAMRTGRWDTAIKAIPSHGGGSTTLSVGGQARWRDEWFHAFNFTPQHDLHGQSRLLLHADLHTGNPARLHGRLFTELRDAQSYGRSLPGGVRPTDADRHDVQNLFVDVAWGASFLRVGRQEIAINRERLFGVPDWANTRRGSQGTRLQIARYGLMVEAIDARPLLVKHTEANLADSAARFRTISLGNAAPASAPTAARPRMVPTTWQGFVYEQITRTSAARTHRLTTGGRALWQWGSQPKRRRYSVDLEGARQSGSTGTNAIDAWFLVAESQVVAAQLVGAPTLALGIDLASGDRAATPTTREGFTVLYPAAHAHGGYADVLGRTNLRELHAISTWDPLAPLSLRAAWYRFDRLRLDDGVYTKQTALFRAPNGSTARHAADELDITGTWKLTRHLRVIAGGALVLPGAFLRETPGGARTERWAFTGSSYTF